MVINTIKFVGLQFIERQGQTVCMADVHATVDDNGEESHISRKFRICDVAFSDYVQVDNLGKDNAKEYQHDFFDLMKASLESEIN